ncbi:MAG: cytochrome P450 [Methylococcaceae bacterium]
MTDFIPPYPPRSTKALGAFELIKHARRDLLSIWTEQDFKMQFFGAKIINRSVFVVNRPDLVRYVFLENNANYERKSPLMRKALEPILGKSLFISDGEIWKKHRMIETPLFSADQVAKYADVMVTAAEERAEQWAQHADGSLFYVQPEMGQLTAEIICRSLFGNQLGSEQAAEVVSCFAQYQAVIEQMDVMTFFGLPSWIPSFGIGKAMKPAKRIHEIVDGVIAQGIKSDNQNTLLAEFIKRLGNPNVNEALNTEQIRNELVMLFMAGHEGTANTLAWTWFLISQCPEVEAKVHQEVDAVLGNGRATFDSFAGLVYTRAVIEEALRLYPPVPILSRECIKDDKIRHRDIPAGSIVMAVPWLLHRHRLYWEKPDHFIPERFLPDAPVKIDKFAYIPFSVGPRVCVAKFFGLVEATLCVATLARRFRLRVPEGQTITHECRLTLRPSHNLPMIITKR